MYSKHELKPDSRGKVFVYGNNDTLFTECEKETENIY